MLNRNEERLAQLKAGDPVYIATSGGSYGPRFRKGTVSKKTSTGQIEVKVGSCVYRFNPDGKERGKKYSADWIDTVMPVEEREADLAKTERMNAAASAVSDVKPQNGVNHRWGYDGLKKEVERLRGLLDKAALLVERIEKPETKEAGVYCVECGGA